MQKTFKETYKDLSIKLQTSRWTGVRQAKFIGEYSLQDWGSDELFIYDINNDGIPEFLWLQSQGIFKSDLYVRRDFKKYHFLEDSRGLDCLTATNTKCEILWQVGKPFEGSQPYCSHAGEQMVTVYQTTNRVPKIAMLAAPNVLRVVDGKYGNIDHELELPADNFALIKTAYSKSGHHFIIGVMDAGVNPFSYGNPTLVLNSSFEIMKQILAVGNGHQVWVHDFDHDDEDEFMLGYQLFNINGNNVWTLDYWSDKQTKYMPDEQHVDSISPIKIGGQFYAAIAGSDRLYWITEYGQVIWHYSPRHAQYVLVGNFLGKTAEPVIILVDSKNGTKLLGLSISGDKCWEKNSLPNWPMGRPKCVGNKPAHMGVPIVKWESPDERPDLAIFFENGWPYGLNGRGNIKVAFPLPPSFHHKQEIQLPDHRPNDFGYSYQARCADINGDNEEEVIIYDRQHMWIYKIPEFSN